jgi:hypothetical protein
VSTLLGEETSTEPPAGRFSRSKRSKASQYTSAVLWIRKDNYAFARVESFVGSGRATPELLTHQQHSGRLDLELDPPTWRGSHTRLLSRRFEYNLPLKDDFTLQAIRRQ